MPWRRNEAAAVEITALAAGAGPPAKRIATRRIGRAFRGGRGLGRRGGGHGRKAPVHVLVLVFVSSSFDSTIGASDSIDPADDGEVAPGSVAGITTRFCAFIQGRGRARAHPAIGHTNVAGRTSQRLSGAEDGPLRYIREHGRQSLSSSDLPDGPDGLGQDGRRRGAGAPAGCRGRRDGLDDDLPADGHRHGQADDGRARRNPAPPDRRDRALGVGQRRRLPRLGARGGRARSRAGAGGCCSSAGRRCT